jgi:hypothetical protein
MLSKKTIAIAVLTTALLALSGMFVNDYFHAHYILLNEQDVARLEQAVQQNMQLAFQVGKTVCQKAI